jgi:glutamate N-acetyltransferase/amino-acid N-acetyltransferase
MPREAPKPARMTLTLVALDQPTANFAAVFTRNAFPGAPILVGRKRLDAPALGAIVINNKISNVCAPGGVETAERVSGEVGRLLGLDPTAVLPSSTGVIGWGLPVDAMISALPQAVAALAPGSALPMAEGIVTTDLYPKVRRAVVGNGSLIGIAKGAGMVEPNLATMLVYLFTDLAIGRDSLRRMLPRAVATSFNTISVDSDTSTSDTVALLSTGRVPCEDHDAFEQALTTVCRDLGGGCGAQWRRGPPCHSRGPDRLALGGNRSRDRQSDRQRPSVQVRRSPAMTRTSAGWFRPLASTSGRSRSPSTFPVCVPASGASRFLPTASFV